MELSKIVTAYEALTLIKRSNDLPFSLAWKIADHIDALEKHYKRFSEEQQALASKYGSDNGNGTYTVIKDKREKFNKDLEDMLTHEVEISINPDLTLIELIDAKITVTKDVNLAALKPFISKEKIIPTE